MKPHNSPHDPAWLAYLAQCEVQAAARFKQQKPPGIEARIKMAEAQRRHAAARRKQL